MTGAGEPPILFPAPGPTIIPPAPGPGEVGGPPLPVPPIPIGFAPPPPDIGGPSGLGPISVGGIQFDPITGEVIGFPGAPVLAAAPLAVVAPETTAIPFALQAPIATVPIPQFQAAFPSLPSFEPSLESAAQQVLNLTFGAGSGGVVAGGDIPIGMQFVSGVGIVPV